MNEIIDIYTMRPFQGYRRLTLDLKDLGYEVNHKKVYRLMKLMSLQAIYPNLQLSQGYTHACGFSFFVCSTKIGGHYILGANPVSLC